MTLTSIKEEKLSSELKKEFEILHYLANTLEYSIDDYFYIFDKHMYERWAIGEELYPLLQERYKLEDQREINQKYIMEVIDEIVRTQSEKTKTIVKEESLPLN